MGDNSIQCTFDTPLSSIVTSDGMNWVMSTRTTPDTIWPDSKWESPPLTRISILNWNNFGQSVDNRLVAIKWANIGLCLMTNCLPVRSKVELLITTECLVASATYQLFETNMYFIGDIINHALFYSIENNFIMTNIE